MSIYKVFFFFLFTTISIFSFAQENTISLDSLNLKGKKLLFERYQTIGMHCTNRNNFPKFCDKEAKLFDNNIEDLIYQHEEALNYLYSGYEIIDKEQIDKVIYEDLSTFRYLFQYKPIASKAGNSCFANPGSLVIEFYLFDRVLNKKYKIDLNYAFFICDIQILVNAINERLVQQELELQQKK